MSWVESCRFAPVRIAFNGVPAASTMRWCLLPVLRRSVGLGPVFSPMHGPHRGTVGDHAREVEPVGVAQFGQQEVMQLVSHASLLPVACAAPTGHARAAAHFPGQHFPRQAGLQDEQNADQDAPLVEALAARWRVVRRWRRQQEADHFL
jgi:hypothetical protein